MTTTTKKKIETRTTMNDGWSYRPGDDDSVMCRECRAQLGEPPSDADSVPLGGNMVPEVLECCACGKQAQNPVEITLSTRLYRASLGWDDRHPMYDILNAAAQDVEALDLIADHLRRIYSREVSTDALLGRVTDTIEATGRSVR